MITRFTLNGRAMERDVEPRRLLADVLRQDCLTFSVHLGCEHGVCGACTILLDGRPVRSCLLYAVQADGCSITTAESDDPHVSLTRQAFEDCHGLQCGFCTPGFVVTVAERTRRAAEMSEDAIREDLSGNICRCTGYVNIVRAVRRAAELTEALENQS